MDNYSMQKELIDTMSLIVDDKIKKSSFIRMVYGTVTFINGDTAKVTINGDEYVCNIKDGINIAVGDVVNITYLQSNESNKLIIGKEGTVFNPQNSKVMWGTFNL